MSCDHLWEVSGRQYSLCKSLEEGWCLVCVSRDTEHQGGGCRYDTEMAMGTKRVDRYKTLSLDNGLLPPHCL